jgi:CubicO group peptidase (beta-lactamase class C family)
MLRFTFLITACFFAAFSFCSPAIALQPTVIYPGESWQKVKSPELLGWSSEKLAAARAYSEQIGSAAVMVVDDGTVVDAWGDVTRKFQCHSMRKSLLSALIGIHVEEGHIDLSKTLEEMGIDDNEPSLTETEKQATVGDLIKARSGIYHPALYEHPIMKARRPERHSHAPGTFYYYNNWDFNALGTIFEQETGTKIFEEFDRRIAKPLQMEDFKVSDCHYVTGYDSIHPAYPFRMSTRDLARFGLLFLREGRWKNKQIVSSEWVRESTATHSVIGSYRGYGYMWSTSENGGPYPNIHVKQRTFGHSGKGVHFFIVLPSRNLVIVHRVNTDKTGPYPNPNQLGRLLWLILDAAGEKEIGENPYIEAVKGVRLTADNLKETLEESSIREGASVVSATRDGTMSVSMEGKLIDTGKWWTEGDKFCSQWKRIREGKKACRFLVLDGTILKWFDLDGTLDGKGFFSRE